SSFGRHLGTKRWIFAHRLPGNELPGYFQSPLRGFSGVEWIIQQRRGPVHFLRKKNRLLGGLR
ncbi:MAG: hypothetical protein ACOYXY_03380, partial [Thermodesulfobacteriota bacterium]